MSKREKKCVRDGFSDKAKKIHTMVRIYAALLSHLLYTEQLLTEKQQRLPSLADGGEFLSLLVGHRFERERERERSSLSL